MARLINFFDGASSGTVPTIGNIVASDLVQYANDAAFEAAELGAPKVGNIYFNTTSNTIRFYNGTAWLPVIDESSTQTMANKTIDGIANTLTNLDADNVIVDPISGLTATDVQAAINEHQVEIETNTANVADIRTTTGTSVSDTDMGTYTGSVITDNQSTKANIQELETEVELKIPSSEKGSANGVATLDGGGKVPSSQLPETLMDFLGNWNASTNTPTLIDGTGSTGDVFNVSVAGTIDLGSGNIIFDAGDWAVYNGTIWELSINSDEVKDVNGQTGNVVLDTDDISEGTNKYFSNALVDANAGVIANTAKVSASGSINVHSDVDTVTDTPVVGEVLTWDGSNWVPDVGGGTGQGGINYFKNKDFEVDGSDVTTTGNITPGLDTVTNIRGSQSLTLTIGTGATTADFVDFEMDDVDPIDVDGSKILPISFEYFTDGNFSTNDVQFVLRRLDATAADIDLIDELGGKILSSSGKIPFHSRVQIDNDANTYALRMKVLVAPSVASKITIDSMKIGPDEVVPGAIITAWQPYTATLTNLGNATQSLEYRRVGDSIDIRGAIIIGSTLPTGTFLVSLPGGLSFGPTVVGSSLSMGYFAGSTSSPFFPLGTINKVSATTFGALTVGANAQWNATNPATWSQNDKCFVNLRGVPIDGWEATASLSTSEIALQTIFTKTTNIQTPTGTISAAYNVAKFASVTDKFSLYNVSTGQWTASHTGEIDVHAFLEISFTSGTSRRADVRIINITTGEILIGSSSSTGATTRLVPEIGGMLSVTRGDIVEVQSLCTGASPSYTGGTTGATFSIAYRPDFSVFSTFGSETVAARYTSNSGQSIGTAGTIEYEDVDYDTHGAYNTGTGVYTIPENEGGIYTVNASFLTASLDSWSAGHQAGLRIFVNGTGVNRTITRVQVASTFSVYASMSDTLQLVAGDTLEIRSDTSISTSLSTSAEFNWFSIARIK
jgi:hypothetical protein